MSHYNHSLYPDVTAVVPAWLVLFDRADPDALANIGFDSLLLAGSVRRRRALRRVWTTTLLLLHNDMYPVTLEQLGGALLDPRQMSEALESCLDGDLVREALALLRDDRALIARVRATWGPEWIDEALDEALADGPPSAGPDARRALYDALVRRTWLLAPRTSAGLEAA